MQLDDNPIELTGRRWLTRLLAAGLVFGYSILMAFVGGLSNVTQLCTQWSWYEDLWLEIGGQERLSSFRLLPRRGYHCESYD